MFSRLNKNDSPYTVADFLEYECLITKSSISSLSYRSLLSISDDELNNDGIESSDDFSVDKLDSAIAECYHRSQNCPNQYPFITGRSSLELKANSTWHKDVYAFLLFATRLNMREQRVQAGYDGTQLFEELCALVAKEYFGVHSIAKVFGTSAGGSFNDKVEQLLHSLHIKGQYKEPEGSTGKQKDGNLDIVAWIPFADDKDGQMIAMGQCKTGTHWEEMLNELDPYDFFSCYSTQQPYAKPQKMFFVAESFGSYKWQERCTSGGILFDRTRIMEYLPNEIDRALLEKIKTWNCAAMVAEQNMEE